MAIKGVTSAVIKLDNRLTVWLSKIGDPEICLTFGPLNSTTHFLSSSQPEYWNMQPIIESIRLPINPETHKKQKFRNLLENYCVNTNMFWSL